jgi:putative Ca2+/H+ antiporter (TMEM165/GDT1 family)
VIQPVEPGEGQARRIEMDWRLLITTFGTIFLSELGDKTQIATLSFASAGSSRWVVFAGASLALISTSALAVLIGEGLGRLVSPLLLRRLAGVLFIALGILFFLRGPET